MNDQPQRITLGRVGPSLRPVAHGRIGRARLRRAARASRGRRRRAVAKAADGQFAGRTAALELFALRRRPPAPFGGRGQEARRHNEGSSAPCRSWRIHWTISWPSIPTAPGGCRACWRAAPGCWRSPTRWASTIRFARSARCSGAFVAQSRFPIPGLLTCSVGATCDDFSAIAQRLESLGFPIVWWEIPHRRPPDAEEEAVELPGGFRPGRAGGIRACELERVREALAAYAGQPLDNRRQASGRLGLLPAPARKLLRSVTACNKGLLICSHLQQLSALSNAVGASPSPPLEERVGERIPRHFDALCAPELDEVVGNSHSSQHAVVQGIANVEFGRLAI